MLRVAIKFSSLRVVILIVDMLNFMLRVAIESRKFSVFILVFAMLYCTYANGCSISHYAGFH